MWFITEWVPTPLAVVPKIFFTTPATEHAISSPMGQWMETAYVNLNSALVHHFSQTISYCFLSDTWISSLERLLLNIFREVEADSYSVEIGAVDRQSNALLAQTRLEIKVIGGAETEKKVFAQNFFERTLDRG